jgi:hypothetical protein
MPVALMGAGTGEGAAGAAGKNRAFCRRQSTLAPPQLFAAK